MMTAVVALVTVIVIVVAIVIAVQGLLKAVPQNLSPATVQSPNLQLLLVVSGKCVSLLS